ncbi:MAG: hypothetical protein QOJ22_681 [Thermoleophilaceae bacterium]|jgi:uncharacterized protein (DUF1501 family)|nr:hypothetical protein [Thermoleophilaceae bacterium]
MAHRHCDSFERRGMPPAAGSGLSRRSFLMRGAGLALSVYGGSVLDLDGLRAGVAQAAAPSDSVIVSVFLEGGIDSLSLIAPLGDPLYRRLRPRLALRADGLTRFKGDDRLAWHPAAGSLAELYGEGKLAVMPAVGYEDPDQSHFTSRHFYEVGALDPHERTGWLGRWLDRVGSPDNPLQGLSLDGRLAPALASARVPVASVSGPEDYAFWARNVWGPIEDRMLEAIGELGSAHAGGGDSALGQAGGAAAQSAQIRTQLSPFAEDGGAVVAPVPYPESEDDFPRRLKDLAGLLAAGLPIRAVALQGAGEYDTHDNQPEDFASGLKLTADSLLAFQRDLEARGLADRVVVHVWSEFGRRAEENGSLGTDHGAAGAGFLMGSRVKGGLVGEFPGLRKLDAHGNLRSTCDFRAVQSSLLEQWLGTDAGSVIPGAAKLARPRLIR